MTIRARLLLIRKTIAVDGSSHTSASSSTTLLKEGNTSLLETAPTYIKAIMTPNVTVFPRLSCPTPSGSRYEYLRGNISKTPEFDTQVKYFFALDLHQCADLLPRLVGSIVETMRFLGPKYCALSIVEGRSDDGTFEILKLLRPEIEGIGARYYFDMSDLDPKAQTGQIGHRIVALAELRNQALKPMLQHSDLYSHDTTILFINDVSICMEDILELIHQRFYQSADMTCAMDWTYVGSNPTFYDVWIARGMNGDSFFEIPEDGNWNSAWNIFWNNPKALANYNSYKPFQVFSCWNGATAFTAKPILEQTIKFRNSAEDECYQGEPELFCKDMWRRGYGKIMVIPAVNLEYTDKAATKIKVLKGYVSQYVNKDGDNDDDQSTRIDWETDPPSLVKCIPQSYANQTWVPWNE
ncbi:hypothetical protein MMC17_006510 [Xylographa soralifera]|nr:hypothetical protein [Xylographa soralifera]